MIHLHYAYHLFRFRSPQMTSSFRFVLTDSTYLPFEEERFVVLRAPHPTVTSYARRSRKLVAVHKVKSKIEWLILSFCYSLA